MPAFCAPVALLGVLASPPAVPASAPAVAAPRSTAAAATAPASSPAAERRTTALLAALCPKGETCAVVADTPAGTDAAGRSLALAGVEVRSKPFEETFGGPCYPQPYGLVHLRGDAAEEVEPLVVLHAESECQYGASGGDEEIALRENRIVYSYYGGSAWGWSQGRTWATHPKVELLETRDAAYWKLGPNTTETTTNARTGLSRVRWSAPSCRDFTPDDPMAAPLLERAFTVIPRHADPKTNAAWKTAPFPPGALTVTSAGEDGYVVHGAPGTPVDARMRLVALDDRTLLVEVADDRVLAGGATWILDDHLEIWAGDSSLSWDSPCLETRAKAPLPEMGQRAGNAWQWGVRLTDGHVSRGGGKPKVDPKVERVPLTSADWGEVTRLRIELPTATPLVTVVYSDTDDTKTQERLIATSAVSLKDPFSLGRIAAPPK